MLTRMADLIQKHAAELAHIEARDTGKTNRAAAGDVTALARYFEFYGGAADKLYGETIPYLNGYMVALLREPHGVTGHVLPWNYPAQMFGRTLAPSLAVGNATVLKPAQDACAITLRLAELTREAGFPPGAVNVVTGRGSVAGVALVSAPGCRFRLLHRLARGGAADPDHVRPALHPLHAGTGRQIAAGRLADADFDAAIPVICKAIIQNAGRRARPAAACSSKSAALRSVQRQTGRGVRQTVGRVAGDGPGLRAAHHRQAARTGEKATSPAGARKGCR